VGLGVGNGLGAMEKLRSRSMEKLFLGVRKEYGARDTDLWASGMC